MTNKSLTDKVDKIEFSKLVASGIPSNCLGLVFQQYQEKYGAANVWSDANTLYIKTNLGDSK